MDPFANWQSNLSAYSYAGNNPITFVEFEGGFRIDPIFAKRYPNFAKLVQYGLPKIVESSNFVNALSKLTGYSPQKINEIFQYGTEPWLTPERNFEGGYDYRHGFASVSDARFSDDPGTFDESWQDNIFLGNDALQEMECALQGGDDEEINWAVFKIVFLICHESSHYALYHAQGPGKESPPEREYGAMFEERFLGRRFTYKWSKNEATSTAAYGLNDDELRTFFEQNLYPNAIHLEFDRLVSAVRNSKATLDMKEGDPSINSTEREWEKRKPGNVVGQKVECGK